jgi:hypothetical protein
VTTDTGPQKATGPAVPDQSASSAATGPQSGLVADQGSAWPTETAQARHERQHLLIDQAHKAWRAAMEAGVRRSPEAVAERLRKHLNECHGIIHVGGLRPTVAQMHAMHVREHQQDDDVHEWLDAQ